jgi:hypothetical protein
MGAVNTVIPESDADHITSLSQPINEQTKQINEQKKG